MKNCLMIIAVLMAMNLQAQNGTTKPKEGFAVIKGHIKNNVIDFWELIQEKYIGLITISVPVDKNGNFSKEIKVEGDVQDAIVLFDTASFPLFIRKKDTIEINWDANDFEKTFTLENSKSERDRDLQINLSSCKLYKKNYVALQDSLDKIKSVDSIFSMINNYYNEEIEALLVHGVYNGTTKIATDIYYRYALQLLYCGFLPAFNLYILPAYDLYIKHPSANSRMLPMLGEKEYYKRESENAFRTSGAYRRFLFDYVRLPQPFNRWEGFEAETEKENRNRVLPSPPSWSDYYAGLGSFHSYELRDWFITQSIINDFQTYSFDEASAIYKEFMTKVRTPYYADTLKAFYANIQRLKPGSPAPAFALKDENGKAVSLSDFRGKVVFIDFWGIHCGPCLSAIQYSVPALHEKYKGRNIIFLNICVDGDEKEWKEDLVKLNLKGVNLITEGCGTKNSICKAYGVNGIPHYYLIDVNGRIADNNAPDPFQREILYSALDKLLIK